ncbi:hypothetical protein C8Q72DRAFT_519006 [Fomitopsis betulina]|nr:hypothetical protein C8Q72DRAFT_519006 [Fomitopsis betulina]
MSLSGLLPIRPLLLPFLQPSVRTRLTTSVLETAVPRQTIPGFGIVTSALTRSRRQHGDYDTLHCDAIGGPGSRIASLASPHHRLQETISILDE